MEMAITTVAMLACLQLKHYVVDYVLQPPGSCAARAISA